jgi:hypothetical protein
LDSDAKSLNSVSTQEILVEVARVRQEILQEIQAFKQEQEASHKEKQA